MPSYYLPRRPLGPLALATPGLGIGEEEQEQDVGLPTPPAPRMPVLGSLAPRPTPPESQYPTGLRPEQRRVTTAFGPDEETIGTISYGGPQLNTEEALAGLRAANEARGGPYIPGGGLSTAEITRLANRPQEVRFGPEAGEYAGRFQYGTAPGASQYWQKVLGEREAISRPPSEQAEQVGAIQEGITAQHPAIQATAEAAARRAAYPSQLTGQAQLEAARIGAEGRLGAAQSSLEARRATRDATAMNAALRGLQEAYNLAPAVGQKVDDPKFIADRDEAIQRWLGIVQSIQQGKGFTNIDLLEYEDIEDEF